MGTTTNYSWPIPEDTDLVKDGAEAIRDLGNAIDTSAADFGGGLVHIETRSVSAVSAESFNDVFSSTYDNYRVITRLQRSTANPINIRFRASGSDDSQSLYNSSGIRVGGTTLLGTSSTLASSGLLSQTNVADVNAMSFDFYSPFLTQFTHITGLTFTPQSSDNNLFLGVRGIQHKVSSSFDGFTLLADTAGNMTGTISIYGYRK
jgi:hypothetical protein